MTEILNIFADKQMQFPEFCLTTTKHRDPPLFLF